MIKNKSTSFIPVIALLAAMVLWASSFIALKLAFRGYDPMVVIFGRMFVASICFLFLIKKIGGNRYRRGDFKYLLLMAFFEPCLYFVFEAAALKNTTASQAGMITAIFPLMAGIGAHIFLKESISKKTITGFFIAAAGAFWLTMGSAVSENAPNPALGNFLEFLAMICATGYTLILKKLTSRYTPLFLTAFQAFTGSIFFLPFLFLGSTEIHFRIETVPFLAIIYLGIFVTLAAYGLFNFGVSRIPANQASAFVNLIPVFAIILAWFILGERFTSEQYIASAVIFTGVYISQNRK